jgi:ATP-dependent Clp protease adaptor protein ClpS
MTTTPATPDVETRPDVSEQHEVLPPWKVILHNDDHNEMLYVVTSLLKSVPKLGRARAVEIMFEAHNHGQALVCTCPFELAELYRDRLESFGLTATIEKA